jgi:predicted secreted Zn-dependent protease
MSTKKAREIFKEMANLCYGEDCPELHKEIISLEIVTKKDKDAYKYDKAMQELLDIVPLFSEDFPQEIFSQLEEIYEEFLQNRL